LTAFAIALRLASSASASSLHRRDGEPGIGAAAGTRPYTVTVGQAEQGLVVEAKFLGDSPRG
jgi:hypothetical protein